MNKTKPFVSVIWRDAEDGPTWASEKEAIDFAEQECLVDARGWLVKKTKKFIVLAADKSISGNNPGELGRICKIPVKMIVSIREIHDAPTAPAIQPPNIPPASSDPTSSN